MKANASTAPVESTASEAAFRWLLKSGIQDQSGAGEYDGGVNAWWDLKSESYPFIYGEITGYAVNAYLYAYREGKCEESLEAAKRAAGWLIKNRDKTSGLIRNRAPHANWKQTYYEACVFTFDQWISIYGLAALYGETKESIYLETADSIARFLLKHTLKPDGSFQPIYNLETQKSEAYGDKWSRQSGSFHAKHLMALQLLFEHTKETLYQGAAARLAQNWAATQGPSGRFITQESNHSTHLHPHLYALEGFLSYALSAQNKEYAEVAEKGIHWILSHQKADGGAYSVCVGDTFLPYERTDILAQTLRVGSALFGHGYLKDAAGALEALRARLLSYQITNGSQAGGFLYGQEQDGTIHYHVNAWVTMFAGQALRYHDQAAESQAPVDMAFFI